ncbi:MAG: sigma-70 family RNA polymerase sigma factor [Candidatus Omnitrophota bacterium]|nr:sigma-70 family RNA polymerase sigma factor [Candidatus Omnitrophota bacterium]
MMIDNESEIIERIKNGDQNAFCELVEKYKEKALNIAFSFCRNYEDAKDISQEAFIKAFKTIRNFRSESRFYTWFYRILINLCKDYLRRRMKNKAISANIRINNEAQEEESIFEVIASGLPGPKEQLLNKELGEELTKALNSLPEQQKRVFTLKNIHGLKINEIAEIIKCAEGTIKAHLFKATLNLQERLAAYACQEV